MIILPWINIDFNVKHDDKNIFILSLFPSLPPGHHSTMYKPLNVVFIEE